MNRKRYLPVAFLLVTVAVAGCTSPLQDNGTEGQQNQITFTQNDGLSISFSSETAEYFSNADSPTDAAFTADVQNTGEGEADLQSLKLFGASWATNEVNAQGTDRVVRTFANDAAVYPPVERENNLPGGRDSFIFTPSIDVNIPTGQSDTYTVGLETAYEYTSRTRSKLTIMQEERFRDQRANRQQMSNDISGAPVQVRFKGMTPFPARDTTLTIPVEVTNVGDGKIKNGKVTLTVRTEGGNTLGNCAGTTKQLFEGSRTFTCQYDFGGINVPETTKTLIAEAGYTYVEEDSTTVTVVGGSTTSNNNDGGDGDEPPAPPS